jgi:hypothetical protein
VDVHLAARLDAARHAAEQTARCAVGGIETPEYR